jgi:hypothetical protein
VNTGWLANLPPYRFDQGEKMWAGVLIVGSLYIALFAFVPGFDRFAWPCLWKTCTGIECVGCGFTRACAALLTMNWKAAWHFNPLVFLIVPYLAWRAACIATGFVTRRSLSAIVPPFVRKTAFWAAVVVASSYSLLLVVGKMLPRF